MLFVDKNKIPKITAEWVGNSDYRIHPLPLLTAEGNGEGGGDFFGKDTNNLEQEIYLFKDFWTKKKKLLLLFHLIYDY